MPPCLCRVQPRRAFAVWVLHRGCGRPGLWLGSAPSLPDVLGPEKLFFVNYLTARGAPGGKARWCSFPLIHQFSGYKECSPPTRASGSAQTWAQHRWGLAPRSAPLGAVCPCLASDLVHVGSRPAPVGRSGCTLAVLRVSARSLPWTLRQRCPQHTRWKCGSPLGGGGPRERDRPPGHCPGRCPRCTQACRCSGRVLQ